MYIWLWDTFEPMTFDVTDIQHAIGAKFSIQVMNNFYTILSFLSFYGKK